MEEQTQLLKEILGELKLLNSRVSDTKVNGADHMEKTREALKKMSDSLPPELRGMMEGLVNGL